MDKEIVVIVGKQNIGKSTLFNAITNKKTSIVKDDPGITRDRIYADCFWRNYKFVLIDTGGINVSSNDTISLQVKKQTEIAIKIANVIIFLVDFKTGITADDLEIANILRKSNNKNIILVVNKVDNFAKDLNYIYQFCKLGFGDPYAISALSKLNIGDMLDKVVSYFTLPFYPKDEMIAPRISVIGKSNVGKSSLINKILGDDRLIVSNINGTTRDHVDVAVKYKNNEYIFVDTCGIRKKNKVKENIDKICISSSIFAIKKSNIAILVIDPLNEITFQDLKIAEIAYKNYLGILIVINKFDLIKGNTEFIEKIKKQIKWKLAFINYAKTIFVSSKTGYNLDKILENIDEIKKNQSLRISTGVLNEFIIKNTLLNQTPSKNGKRLKIYYITQININPPTFLIFVNYKSLITNSYRKYIENKLRESFVFTGTTIKIIIRDKRK